MVSGRSQCGPVGLGTNQPRFAGWVAGFDVAEDTIERFSCHVVDDAAPEGAGSDGGRSEVRPVQANHLCGAQKRIKPALQFRPVDRG